MITDRLKDVWKAAEAFHEAAFELPECRKREIGLNMSKYIKQDLKMLAHQFGLTLEDLNT